MLNRPNQVHQTSVAKYSLLGLWCLGELIRCELICMRGRRHPSETTDPCRPALVNTGLSSLSPSPLLPYSLSSHTPTAGWRRIIGMRCKKWQGWREIFWVLSKLISLVLGSLQSARSAAATMFNWFRPFASKRRNYLVVLLRLDFMIIPWERSSRVKLAAFERRTSGSIAAQKYPEVQGHNSCNKMQAFAKLVIFTVRTWTLTNTHTHTHAHTISFLRSLSLPHKGTLWPV